MYAIKIVTISSSQRNADANLASANPNLDKERMFAKLKASVRIPNAAVIRRKSGDRIESQESIFGRAFAPLSIGQLTQRQLTNKPLRIKPQREVDYVCVI